MRLPPIAYSYKFPVLNAHLNRYGALLLRFHQPASVCFWPSLAADQSLTQQTITQKYLWRVRDSVTVLNTLALVLFSCKSKETGEGRGRIKENTCGFLVHISLLSIVVRTRQKQNTWCRGEMEFSFSLIFTIALDALAGRRAWRKMLQTEACTYSNF